MSVYTPLSLEEVQAFAQDYGLQVCGISPIKGGLENTNYFIDAVNGHQYVLTVFEELDATAAERLIPVLQHLHRQHLPVAVPLATSQQWIGFLHHKPAQIAPRLPGHHPDQPTLQQTMQMGQTLARLHVALQHVPLSAGYTARPSLQQLASELTLSNADRALLTRLIDQLHHMHNHHSDCLHGLIHADLFRDNVLFDQQQVSGILDFSELQYGSLLLDIAITLNDFCTDYPTVALNEARQHAFLQGYGSIRPLTADEQHALPLYLALAAALFWLLRVQVHQRNQQENRQGEHILQKDPLEMRDMLCQRLAACP